jgi:uncharacterized membrane protein YuzA (DUF378 family)
MTTRAEILFSAELSARYHRRRAAFLERTSALMSTVILVGGAGAFASLFGDATIIAKIATLIIALIGVVQIVFQMDRCAAEHRRWLREWTSILVEVKEADNPSREAIAMWEKRRAVIETECVSELRALQIDCWNRTAISLRYQVKPTPIRLWQRALIQVFSFESWFANPMPRDT